MRPKAMKMPAVGGAVGSGVCVTPAMLMTVCSWRVGRHHAHHASRDQSCERGAKGVASSQSGGLNHQARQKSAGGRQVPSRRMVSWMSSFRPAANDLSVPIALNPHF
jgi:hypothetical protein